ncbi:hypothetical protein ACFLZJ_00420 [Nanoarchaeota archaeon]
MAFTSIEILALILIVVSVIKIITLLVNPKGWFKFAKGFWKNSALARIVSLILAVVVFYYLTLTMSIVQILAVTLFVALLFAVGLSGRLDDLMKIYDKQVKSGKLWAENWLYTVLWLILLVWGVIELFF